MQPPDVQIACTGFVMFEDACTEGSAVQSHYQIWPISRVCSTLTTLGFVQT